MKLHYTIAFVRVEYTYLGNTTIIVFYALLAWTEFQQLSMARAACYAESKPF